MGSTGAGSYGPACSFNPIATGAPLATTTGSAVFSQGGINLGVQSLPTYALSCEAPRAGAASCTAGIANNNSLLQAAALQSKVVEYAALGLLAVGLFFLWKHVKR
jgi:hypothetical protein